MTAVLLDGKALASKLQHELKMKINASSCEPHLAVLLSHPHPASELYVRTKQKACFDVGINVSIDTTPHMRTDTLIARIEQLNQEAKVHAILVQLPLHPNIIAEKVLEAIDPKKDVDGLHPENLGKLACSDMSGFIPCTPLGIFRLLREYHIDCAGKHVTIIGRSRIVGTPLALLLSRPWPGANATVTLAHSQTKNLALSTFSSDIIVAAVGQPHLLTSGMIHDGAVVVDVGMNRATHSQENSKRFVVGDVDFEQVKKKASFITPVPGGVGPMTIASLLENTYTAFMRQTRKIK